MLSRGSSISVVICFFACPCSAEINQLSLFHTFFSSFFLFFPLFFNKAANYGGCITGKLNTIEKGVCEAEFRRLAECMKRHAAKQ